MSKKKEREKEIGITKSIIEIIDDTIEELKYADSKNIIEIVENFISIVKKLSREIDNQLVEDLINKIQSKLDKIQNEKQEKDEEARKIILSTIDLFNSEYGTDLVFEGDVDHFYSKTFPLISYYVNKKK
ncbi:MAG: hypothetical protein LBJ93_02110 [Clostridiales bacterium]|nr:hypothetical protein [Clostridiales bacterium]